MAWRVTQQPQSNTRGFKIETCEHLSFGPASFPPSDPHILGIVRCYYHGYGRRIRRF